ncbi:MAG: hypothetical protein BRD41_07140 [Bacteroidetes bacterium QS_1_63_11]|nr:MAG: hypothetical protein BRD41_07140 [Bacteroidetes bacterium QS_1_63_11]
MYDSKHRSQSRYTRTGRSTEGRTVSDVAPGAGSWAKRKLGIQSARTTGRIQNADDGSWGEEETRRGGGTMAMQDRDL